jgi:hypothetical protein
VRHQDLLDRENLPWCIIPDHGGAVGVVSVSSSLLACLPRSYVLVNTELPNRPFRKARSIAEKYPATRSQIEEFQTQPPSEKGRPGAGPCIRLVLIIVTIIMFLNDASALYEALRSSKADVDLSSKSLGLHYRCAIIVSVGLQLNPTLLRLNLQCNHFGNSDAAAIAEALKVNSSLQQLNLNQNDIGASGAEAIAKALKVNNSGLQQLNLRYNHIGDSGAAALAKALKVYSSLQDLSLRENEIGASGAASVTQALMRHSTLRRLDLLGNDIGDSGAMAIEESLERSFLGLAQNVNTCFPEVLLRTSLLTNKHRFLCALNEDGFRSVSMNDVPPALWPHALGKVSAYPSLIFHLVLQIPVIDPPESVSNYS